MTILLTINITLKIVESIVLVILIGAILRKIFQFGIENFSHILLGIVSTLIQTIVVLLPLIGIRSHDELFGIIYTFIVSAVFAGFIMFFDYYSGQLTIKRTGVAIFCISTTAVLAFASLIRGEVAILTIIYYIDGLPYYAWSYTALLVLFPSMLLMAWWGYDVISKSERNVFHQSQIRQLGIMKIGFYIGIVLTAILGIPGSIAIATGKEQLFVIIVYIIQGMSLTLGMGIIAYGYISVDQGAFLQPQAVRAVLVIEENGLPLFEYEFGEEETKGDSALISGAISAISALLSEAFGVSSSIKSINFLDTELLLEFRRNFVVVAISDRITGYLKHSTSKFADSFLENYRTELDEQAHNPDAFKGIKQHLFLSFGIASEN